MSCGTLNPITPTGSTGVIPDSDIFVMGPYEEGVGIEARSTDNGDFAWWFEDGNAAAITEAGVLFIEQSAYDAEDGDYTFDVGLLDSETGEEIWRSQADSWEVQGDAVYLADGEELRKLDLSSGEENWSVNADVSLGADYPVLAVAAAKDMVVVGGEDEAVALSDSDGEELWRESLDEMAPAPTGPPPAWSTSRPPLTRKRTRTATSGSSTPGERSAA